MKYADKTIVPRKQALNNALVEAGHKVHSDKRKKRIDRKEQERLRNEERLDVMYE